MMMSIPGLAHTSPDNIPQPNFEAPAPAIAPASKIPAKAKKRSFFHRTSFGIASWYGAVLNGHHTASGEIFDMNKLTACHRTLPFGTMVRVTDTRNGKSVVVKINDRGVLFKERVIDLSRAAADRLGIRKLGVAPVKLEVLTKQQADEARRQELLQEKAQEAASTQLAAAQ